MKFTMILQHKRKKSDKKTITTYAEEEQYARANVLRDYPKYKIISLI